MDRDQADALIAALGAAIGIPELALDDGGICTLSIGEGELIVNLGHDRDAGTIELMTCLDAVADAAPLAATLLQANFGWRGTSGACFAVEPASGALVLQRRVTAAEATQAGLRPALEDLVVAARSWAPRLAEAPAPATGRPPEWSLRP
jgi:hypothetical protein